VPDVTGMYPMTAYDTIYYAGLQPELIVNTVPDKCSVKETIPAKGEVVKLNSTVKIIAEQDSPTCQPV
jgi:PASTA domain